jgi:Phospholipase D C terminal
MFDHVIALQSNWDTFINPNSNADTPGHLMIYPFKMSRAGKVALEPLTEDIPDFPGAGMFGGRSDIPYVLTT